jgi:hypothetical protein
LEWLSANTGAVTKDATAVRAIKVLRIIGVTPV